MDYTFHKFSPLSHSSSQKEKKMASGGRAKVDITGLVPLDSSAEKASSSGASSDEEPKQVIHKKVKSEVSNDSTSTGDNSEKKKVKVQKTAEKESNKLQEKRKSFLESSSQESESIISPKKKNKTPKNRNVESPLVALDHSKSVLSSGCKKKESHTLSDSSNDEQLKSPVKSKKVKVKKCDIMGNTDSPKSPKKSKNVSASKRTPNSASNVTASKTPLNKTVDSESESEIIDYLGSPQLSSTQLPSSLPKKKQVLKKMPMSAVKADDSSKIMNSDDEFQSMTKLPKSSKPKTKKKVGIVPSSDIDEDLSNIAKSVSKRHSMKGNESQEEEIMDTNVISVANLEVLTPPGSPQNKNSAEKLSNKKSQKKSPQKKLQTSNESASEDQSQSQSLSSSQSPRKVLFSSPTVATGSSAGTSESETSKPSNVSLKKRSPGTSQMKPAVFKGPFYEDCVGEGKSLWLVKMPICSNPADAVKKLASQHITLGGQMQLSQEQDPEGLNYVWEVHSQKDPNLQEGNMRVLLPTEDGKLRSAGGLIGQIVLNRRLITQSYLLPPAVSKKPMELPSGLKMRHVPIGAGSPLTESSPILKENKKEKRKRKSTDKKNTPNRAVNTIEGELSKEKDVKENLEQTETNLDAKNKMKKRKRDSEVEVKLEDVEPPMKKAKESVSNSSVEETIDGIQNEASQVKEKKKKKKKKHSMEHIELPKNESLLDESAMEVDESREEFKEKKDKINTNLQRAIEEESGKNESLIEFEESGEPLKKKKKKKRKHKDEQYCSESTSSAVSVLEKLEAESLDVQSMENKSDAHIKKKKKKHHSSDNANISCEVIGVEQGEVKHKKKKKKKHKNNVSE